MTVSTKTLPDGSHQFAPVTLRLEAAAATHAGQVREANEDVYGVFPEERLYVVADGMGGRAAGEIAARIAIDALETFCRENHDSPPETWPFPLDTRYSRRVNSLRVGLKVANRRIREEAQKDTAWYRMGATIAALAFDEDHLITAHAGDVRVYRIRPTGVSRLTRDHSIAEELRAARQAISPEDLAALGNRNVITRALGNRPDVEPTVYVNAYADADIYLLCSDGLWNCVPDERLGAIVLGQPDLESACYALIDAGNLAGGPDNLTALLVRVVR
ncbi:MAG: serine/threonine-protein phosphatase [Deltaproteobacteria bacterium]|nr:serine/threonine-protein phosphatase [Deltaproteobacteria bacterium]